eukprot:11224486-Lingulodinium_polyedra.AAC.1
MAIAMQPAAHHGGRDAASGHRDATSGRDAASGRDATSGHRDAASCTPWRHLPVRPRGAGDAASSCATPWRQRQRRGDRSNGLEGGERNTTRANTVTAIATTAT